MSSTGGRRRSADSARPWLPVLVNSVGAVAALAAWVAAVTAAIEFGSQARNGQSLAWLFVAVGTVGAVACLLLALLLGARVLLLLGILSDYRPKRARGR